MILLRGLPGSGKSTVAAVLAGKEFPVFSVDDFFTTDDGSYEFRYRENHLAYKKCEENVRQAMESGRGKIFVDNTFTMDWEMEPYFRMASEFGYRLHVMTVEHYHSGKNIHDIPEEQLQKMAAKYSVKLL